MTYDHYIAIDWAKENMAIARMTAKSNDIQCIDVFADLDDIKAYLNSKRGRKILTIEETNTSQWLYTELHTHVDKIVICDPYRNKLISEGPKTDKIDAKKLVHLLRANLLKPVFHSTDYFIKLRVLVSGYEDTIKAGVRLKNQKSAIYRSQGKATVDEIEGPSENFVLEGFNKSIKAYEDEVKRYHKEFEAQLRKCAMLRNIKTIPGIGTINAVQLGAIVVDPKRFIDRNHFLSYAGLVRHDKMSGKRSYGSRRPRYSRKTKEIFKTAALSAIQTSPIVQKYFSFLMTEKNYPEHKARHAVARKLATAALGVMKSEKKYNPNSIGAFKALNT